MKTQVLNSLSFAVVISTALSFTSLAPAATAPAKPTATPSAKPAATPSAKTSAKKSKATVKKIAVGPSPTPTPDPVDESETASSENDVDQPIVRKRIESTDAPGVKLEAGSAPLGQTPAAPAGAPEPDSSVIAPTSTPVGAPKVAPEASKTETTELHDDGGLVTDTLAPEATETAPASATATPSAAAATPAATTTSAEPAVSEVTNAVTADQSLKWLINGNARFTSKMFRADGRSAEDRARTSQAQTPHAIILACSESISPPELIFDQGLGEITTIRVAGPTLDASVIKSIEMAVRNYDSHLILVLGHTQCSALEGSPYIGTKHLDPNSKHEVEAALNADGIARDLTSKSAFLKSRVDAKQLSIKSALYWVDSGKVKFY